ncbi:MAG TPA: hypothetical protein VFK05_20865 [Polyangiaceae bacterium]|nr:hypothetical protein [Polyangiaceae bacterium]
MTGLTLAASCGSACAGKVGPTEQGGSGGRNPPSASAGHGNGSAMGAGTPTGGGGMGPSLTIEPSSGAGGMGAGCNAFPDGLKPAPLCGGSSSSGGTSGVVTAGSGGTAGTLTSDALPLIPTDGWIDGPNAAHIQGAIYGSADATSALGMAMNFNGANACIEGTAAKVDQASLPCINQMFTPPATDCWGEYWGAAIGLNLNQTIDPATMQGNTPAPFDASALQGFSFEISGDVVPAPRDLRFQVETSDRQFCNPASKKIEIGLNTVLFSELITECFRVTDPPAPTAETAKSQLIRISWHVVTNSSSTTPFDFCVSNIRALPR